MFNNSHNIRMQAVVGGSRGGVGEREGWRGGWGALAMKAPLAVKTRQSKVSVVRCYSQGLLAFT